MCKINYIIIVSSFLLLHKSVDANIYYVTNNNNAGSYSLRSSIDLSNATPGLDTIYFNISGTGHHTIQLSNVLPDISDPILIDGLSQSGNSISDFTIEISGSATIKYAFRILCGNVSIQGLKIMNFINTQGSAIEFYNNYSDNSNYSFSNLRFNYFNNNTMAVYCDPLNFASITFSNFNISDNKFTNSGGIHLKGNQYTEVCNLKIENNIFESTILNSNAIDMTFQENFQIKNVQINANKINKNCGIYLSLSPNDAYENFPASFIDTLIINDNLIISDSSNVFSGITIDISGSDTAVIHASHLIISDDTVMNSPLGIHIRQAGSSSIVHDVVVEDNMLINNSYGGLVYECGGVGVKHFDAYDFSIQNNSISNNNIGDGIGITASSGCESSASLTNFMIVGNTISGNQRNGINLNASSNGIDSCIFSNIMVKNNIIENNGSFGLFLNANGSNIDGNIFSQNSIHDNDSLGIKIYYYDYNQNMYIIPAFPLPVIVSAVYSGGISTITGHLNGKPNRSYRIEFFTSHTTDISGFGEGETYIGSETILANSSGYGTFIFTSTIDIDNHGVTATSTDLTTNNTSEFGNMVGLGAGINEDKQKNNLISIYPDPATDKVFVEYKTKNKNPLVTLYDVNGNEICGAFLEAPFIEIQLQALTKGVYFIRIDDHEIVSYAKFIKL